MPKGTGSVLFPEGGIARNDASAKFDLGYEIKDTWGNTFRYIKANEALAVGHVVAMVASAAWDSTLVIDGAASSGVTKIHVDTSTSAITANQYAGYYIHQAAASGKGMAYKIKGHGSCSASGEFDVYLEEATAEAFADNAVLYAFNPFLVEKIDATTEVPLGVALNTITSGYYGFVQTGGLCSRVLVGHSTSNAIVLDSPLVPVGSGVEGAMQGLGTGTASAQILQAGVNALIPLIAVGANTVGYIPARFRGNV